MIVEIYLKNPYVWETLNNGRMRSDNLMSYKVHEYIRQTYHSLKHLRPSKNVDRSMQS